MAGKFSARSRVARETQDKKGYNGSTLDTKGYELFKPEEAGACLLDIVAVKAGNNNNFIQPGDLALECTYWVHRGLGPEGRDSVICNRRSGRSRNCPICQAASEAWDAGDKEAYGLLKARQRQLWWVKPVDEDEWKVWDVSFFLFGKQLFEEIDNLDEEEAHFEYFADPTAGSTVKINFAEKSFGSNSFFETSSVRFKQRTTELDLDAINALPSLDDMLKFSTDEQVRALLNAEEPAPAPAPASEPAPWNPPADEPAPAAPAEPAKSDDDDEWEWD